MGKKRNLMLACKRRKNKEVSRKLRKYADILFELGGIKREN